jgi:hypothetical protein
MLNLRPVRLRWRESVSLHRFQNRNLLKLDHFRWHGVEDQLETPRTPAYARSLIAARRYAEAYELLYRLLDAVVDPDGCARELTWICEHWDRVEEANALRFNYGRPEGVQLALF